MQSRSMRTAENDATGVVALAAPARGEFVGAVLEHRSPLLTYARLLTRERTAAEDLVQDTLERALRAASRFRSGTNLRAWLMRIMRNLFTDRCRRSALLRNVTAQAVPDVEVQAPAANYLDLVSMADVDAALQEIGPRHREIFLLAYVKRMPYGAIARQLSISPSTVGTRLWRAKAKLRRALRNARGTSIPAPVAANDVGVGGP